jgi:hypothetical protein
MPLSEHEQRLLEEMERSLYHNDADFVATVGNRGGRRNYRTIVIGILVALLGVAVIIGGVAIRQPLLGVVGFVIMFIGVLLAFSRPKRGVTDAPAEPAAATSKPGFMDRLNERWDKRQDGDDS